GGQIYYLHNEVRDIDKRAEEIRALVPEASVRVAHGQLRERELEQVMLDFYHRRFNLLVCTTIIESGIDVPTANTLTVDPADMLAEAVRSVKSGALADQPYGAGAIEVDLGVTTLLPDDYIPDVHTRLTLYKRLSEASAEAALEDLVVEMVDRFGKLPEAAERM